MTGFLSLWKRIAELGNLLPDITPHVLRHSFISVAADLGHSGPVIGELIGHRSATTTSRYRHLADPVLLAAADRVAAHIQVLMRDAPQTRDVERNAPV